MIDQQSLTWLEVKARADRGIEMCQPRIEQAGLEHGPTEYARGRLSAFREILALAAPPKPPRERPPEKGDVY